MQKRLIVSLVAVVAMFAVALRAQHQHGGESQSGAEVQQQLGDATTAMSSHGGHEHAMGPHMRMSALREATPADIERAKQIVDTARTSLERYKDFKVAEADGFRIF